jgi:hypothetical protein
VVGEEKVVEEFKNKKGFSRVRAKEKIFFLSTWGFDARRGWLVGWLVRKVG